jgi:hypothetical protein
MTTLCGQCGKAPCACASIQRVNPATWASGARLEAIASKLGIARASLGKWTEPDDTLRARVQLSIIHQRPWNCGVPGGRGLDRLASRHGIDREDQETDAVLLARLLLTVAYRRNEPGEREDALELSA